MVSKTPLVIANAFGRQDALHVFRVFKDQRLQPSSSTYEVPVGEKAPLIHCAVSSTVSRGGGKGCAKILAVQFEGVGSTTDRGTTVPLCHSARVHVETS